MGVPVLHVCDKFGVRGSSIHGVSRLFSWWFPRYDRLALRGVPLRPQAPRAGHAVARRAGHPRPPPRPRALRPAHRRRPRGPRPGARGARILHVHGYAAADFGRLAARAVGAKLVLHEHFADPRMPAYQALADRLLRRRTDGAIAVSRSTREFLVNEALRPRGSRAAHLERRAARRVRSRAPRARAPRPARARDSATTPSSSGTIGRLNAQKGHRFLVEAAARLLSRRAPARVLVVGDGDLMGDLRGQAAALGIADRVVFAGHRTDVPDLLGALDVFCISSLYEGTPLALFEAMAAGKAIVSTVGGRLPRGAGGRRHRRARAPRRRGRPSRRPRPCPRRRRPPRAPWAGRPSPPRAATTCARASTRCRPSTTTSSAAGGAEPLPLRRLARSAREAWEVPRDLLLRPLPAVRDRRRAAPGRRPRLRLPRRRARRPSRARLAHLADNGYVTLSADEYLAVLRGEREPPARAVVLTFDDGRGSVWSVAAPLLRQHGMKAVVFLVPGRIRSRPGPPVADLGGRRGGPGRRGDASSRREEGEGALLSWEEIESLARHRPLRLPEPHSTATPASTPGRSSPAS